ncbi:MAG: HDIG domain-containing protein [Chitinophagaceae bacterium]|jgi:phosphonate degradation associated HDIG domain protein|nr:HDIG domain-containing protein [Chitinophagaceae bacterium]
MIKEEAEKIVNEIFSLYENHGNADYIGEPVSQLEHMCQAAQLAEEEGYDDEVVLAAFFHDIGHLCEFIMPVELMEGVGVLDHESIGQAYLVNKGFSERVAKLVRSHVEAKRFLTFKFPEYFEKLSDASKLTLQHQGGRMNAEEAEAFETDPMFELFIKMRTWDDFAKITNKALPDLNRYKQMAVLHLLQNN